MSDTRKRKRRPHRHVEVASVAYAIVETWRCVSCGRRFKRVTSIGRGEPPRGYGIHLRACRKRAMRFELDGEKAEAIE